MDSILTSPDSVINHGQLSAPGFSRHDLLFLQYKLRPPKVKPTTVWMRNFARLDRDKLKEDAANLDLSVVYDASSLDEKVTKLNQYLLKLYDALAPLKAV